MAFRGAAGVDPAPDLPAFIARGRAIGAAERSNYALSLTELCDLMDVPRLETTRPDDAANANVFERAVTFRYPDGSTTSGRIDLYRRGCFVLEATPKRRKKGAAARGNAAWDTATLAARVPAENYARALPANEGRPPFLFVVDVGHGWRTSPRKALVGDLAGSSVNVQVR